MSITIRRSLLMQSKKSPSLPAYTGVTIITSNVYYGANTEGPWRLRASNGRIYVGGFYAMNYVFYSPDDFVTSSGCSAFHYSFGLCETRTGKVIAVQAAVSTCKYTTDNGSTWLTGTQPSSYVSKMLQMADGRLWSIDYNTSLKPYVSSDDGVTWSQLSTGPQAKFKCMFQSRTGAIIMAVHGLGAYRSTDNGATWSSVASTVELCAGKISEFFQHKNQIWTVNVTNAYAYYSDDDGITWSNVVLPSTVSSMCSIQQKRIVAYCTNAHLYYSDDNGQNWVDAGVAGATTGSWGVVTESLDGLPLVVNTYRTLKYHY